MIIYLYVGVGKGCAEKKNYTLALGTLFFIRVSDINKNKNSSHYFRNL